IARLGFLRGDSIECGIHSQRLHHIQQFRAHCLVDTSGTKRDTVRSTMFLFSTTAEVAVGAPGVSYPQLMSTVTAAEDPTEQRRRPAHCTARHETPTARIIRNQRLIPFEFCP